MSPHLKCVLDPEAGETLPTTFNGGSSTLEKIQSCDKFWLLELDAQLTADEYDATRFSEQLSTVSSHFSRLNVCTVAKKSVVLYTTQEGLSRSTRRAA